jgi:shikimate dehydrogenase
LTTRLAVLGSPIAHSKSPALHSAAYEVLGLDWEYEAIEVTEVTLAEFIERCDASWLGLSLTMPLKRAVLPLLASSDELVARTGVANTVLLDKGARGFNTDVYGITEAFRASGVHELGLVHVLGGGATAVSALVAAAQLGASRVQFSLRDPAKGAPLESLGEALGVAVDIRSLDTHDAPLVVPDAVISTLPGHSEHGLDFAEDVRAGSVLLDVAYDPWPSRLATSWLGAGGRVISGLEMLTLQALAQVRVFVTGSPSTALDNEAAVLTAMRHAVAP